MKRILISFLIFALLCGVASAYSLSDGSSPTYRKEITLNNTGLANLSNYQLEFNVSSQSGTDSGINVFLSGKSQADFDDIRFTTSDGSTVVHYWIESIAANNATMWVESPSIVNTTTTKMYIYYGDSGVGNTSNGNNTFIVFDDFNAYNSALWGPCDGGNGTLTWGSSTVQITGTGVGVELGLLGKTLYNQSVMSIARGKNNVATGQFDGLGFRNNYPLWSGSTRYENVQIAGSAASGPASKVTGVFKGAGAAQFTTTNVTNSQQWVNMRLDRNQGSVKWYANGTLMDVTSHADDPTNDMYPFIFIYPVSTNENFTLDYFALANSASVKPAVTTWGAEEGGSALNPLVSFTSNVTSGYAPLGVQFNDTSVTTPTAWNWSYTNLTPGNNTQVWWSTTQNATNTFGAGNWKINLNVTNSSGYNVSTANYWVNVTSPLLVSNFTANKTTVLPSETILFTDSTTGSGIASWNWSWDFGDGNTSTSQNPTKSYSSVGTYSVNLTVYNSTSGFSSLNRTNYITVTDSGGLSGFNQQDIMMDEIYTLHLTFKDASTLADIPVVTVTDNYNDTTVTTVGTAFLQYNYSTVVIYAISTGYYGRSQSYLINRDRVETFYLTPETATANVSSQTVTYYTPWQVRIRVLDSYGIPLEGANVTANYVASTLPSTNTSWLVSAYGVEPVTAGEMVNGAIAMTGVTDSNGGLSFTMFKSIQYTLAITNTTAGISASKTLYPTDQEYIIRVATVTTGTSTLESMQNTSLPVYVLNATAYNLSAVYHDTSDRTSNVMFYVKWRNGTIIHQYDMGDPGTSIVSYNYTIINPGIGTEVIWMYNATRSGL